mmetsp:Transcript_2218/g.5141  ORF Transcript_2218/g.5141 Transcript_2218/m.5141 type:complete len:232 (-) Transcript_2218:369-1064(-)
MVAVEGGRVVELQQPGLQLSIHKHVHPQKFETSVSQLVVWSAHLVEVSQQRLHRYHRLHCQLLQPLPQRIHVVTELAQVLEKYGEASFGSLLRVLGVFGLQEAEGVGLVERVIGQVHVMPVLVRLVCDLVRLCAESHEPVLVEVDPEGITASDQNVQSEIKLVSISKQGILDVLLHNKRIPKVPEGTFNRFLVPGFRKEDVLSLTSPLRLHDEHSLVVVPTSHLLAVLAKC